jgi:hypothetical protein
MRLYCLITGIVFVLAGYSIADMEKQINPFEVEGNWYKANLHTHTNVSDGDVNVPTRIKQYRELNYNVLAITDHEKVTDVSAYSDSNMLVFNGMETHPASGGPGTRFHFVCINVPAVFSRPKNMAAQQTIDAVKAAGGEVIYAHPYWSGHNINTITSVKGYIGIEVANGTCGYKGISSVIWDDLLLAGYTISAVAGDDLHKSENIGKCWTMIKAKSLTREAILNALRSGCYYASTGPIIEDFRIENGIVKLKCSPVMEIHLVGPAANFNDVYAKENKPLTSLEFKREKPERFWYVRAEIVDANGKRAWTNPLIFEKPKKK